MLCHCHYDFDAHIAPNLANGSPFKSGSVSFWYIPLQFLSSAFSLVR